MRVQINRITGQNILKAGCITIGIFALAVAGFFIAKNVLVAHATGIDWVSQDPTAAVDSDRNVHEAVSQNGSELPVYESVFLGTSTTPTQMNVYQAKSFRIGVSGSSVYLGLNSDQHMYVIDGISTTMGMISPNSDNIYYGTYGYEFFDIPAHLSTHQVSGVTHYQLDDLTGNPAIHYFTFDDNSTEYIRGATMSSNGQWVVGNISKSPYTSKGAFVRINLNDFSYKFFTPDNSYYGGGFDPDFTGATTISDNGQFAVIGGLNVTPIIYDLGDTGCGSTATVAQGSWITSSASYTACPGRNLGSAIHDATNQNNYTILTPQFLDESGGQLELVVANEWVKLTASNFTPVPQLDYLALGDSYSSGEGDIIPDKIVTNHYLTGLLGVTWDSDAGACHISDRSYPFELAAKMHLQVSAWKDVSCSGAKTVDIAGYGDSSNFDAYGNFLGQGLGALNVPRLKSLTTTDLISSQGQALENFIPGRVQQIDFVKNYKPKVVTLTAGGNDIGFSKILEACVKDLNPITPCSWAEPQGLKDLGNLIRSEYRQLVSTYTQLKQASPDSKIYAIAYPQFLSAGLCPLDIGLNADEREMAVNGVTYLNQVIKAAASTAGIYYVDDEDAFGYHTQCGIDPDKYVNGVEDGLIAGSESGMFHPNSEGQAAIAQTIQDALGGQTLASFNNCASTTIVCPVGTTAPPTSTYFNPPSTIDRIVAFVNQVENISGQVVGYLQKGADAIVAIDPQIISPDSLISVTLHSDPIDLGTYTTNADGSVSAGITLPSDLDAGYHTIDVQGTSRMGEPIDLTQIVLVEGTNANDVNDNGVNDSLDACLFVAPSGTDDDLDGIDDACDPYINQTPQLYRVRRGDSSKIYNGSTENSTYLYIERNIHASSVTGVTSDSDPDGDGWAIVGVSQGKPYSDTSVPDTAPAANFAVAGIGTSAKPYVYIRAGGYGCVSYTPTSLSPVLVGQIRTIKLVAENTSQCRQEDPSADVDGNGESDNTQALYLARAGDPTVQHTRPDGSTFYESSTKTYLFRNFYSSEAQLGISDYSPTGTAAGNADEPIQTWNLLASTQDSTMPAYNKLVMLTDSNGKPLPTVLTKKQNGQCIAYQPSSTSIIKMTTEYTRGFIKLSTLPTGITCD